MSHKVSARASENLNRLPVLMIGLRMGKHGVHFHRASGSVRMGIFEDVDADVCPAHGKVNINTMH
jgi:hypothetical protein